MSYGPINIPPGMRHGEEEYESGNDHDGQLVQFACARCDVFQPSYMHRRNDLIRDEATHGFLCKKCSVGMTRRPHVTPCAVCAMKG